MHRPGCMTAHRSLCRSGTAPALASPGALGLGRKRSRGSSFWGSMKNLSPLLYEVATTPSASLIVKCCTTGTKMNTRMQSQQGLLPGSEHHRVSHVATMPHRGGRGPHTGEPARRQSDAAAGLPFSVLTRPAGARHSVAARGGLPSLHLGYPRTTGIVHATWSTHHTVDLPEDLIHLAHGCLVGQEYCSIEVWDLHHKKHLLLAPAAPHKCHAGLRRSAVQYRHGMQPAAAAAAHTMLLVSLTTASPSQGCWNTPASTTSVAEYTPTELSPEVPS